jgi:hypothetical protein
MFHFIVCLIVGAECSDSAYNACIHWKIDHVSVVNEWSSVPLHTPSLQQHRTPRQQMSTCNFWQLDINKTDHWLNVLVQLCKHTGTWTCHSQKSVTCSLPSLSMVLVYSTYLVDSINLLDQIFTAKRSLLDMIHINFNGSHQDWVVQMQ